MAKAKTSRTTTPTQPTTAPMRGANYDFLPPVDEQTLLKPFAVASAAHREPNPEVRNIPVFRSALRIAGVGDT
jgi:hypothetical protein